MNGSNLIVQVDGLRKFFPIREGFFRRGRRYVRAVDDVSLFVRRGETFGLVGESGCGKTTLARCMLRAIEPSAGRTDYYLSDGTHFNINALGGRELRRARRHMQLIFQDPNSSLDPRMSVLDVIAEPVTIAGMPRAERVKRVEELMWLVGLDPRYMKRYPHAFSGGQRQRIAIARALTTRPEFIVCDEPVSALDVSVRSQILNLLVDLQAKLGLSYLFISHDLSVVRHLSHRVGVMYVGKMVEMAGTDALYSTPMHPYTEALLSAIPRADPRRRVRRILPQGEVANPANPPPGCYFHPRCRFAQDRCAEQAPVWREAAPEHYVACHFASGLGLQGVRS